MRVPPVAGTDMESVSIEKAYKIGYSEGFAAGEEAMKNLIDKLTSPTISN